MKTRFLYTKEEGGPWLSATTYMSRGTLLKHIESAIEVKVPKGEITWIKNFVFFEKRKVNDIKHQALRFHSIMFEDGSVWDTTLQSMRLKDVKTYFPYTTEQFEMWHARQSDEARR